MAVLIPRKQIEEQKEFTSSLDIGGDLTVSGSLLVSKSFFFGNELTDKNEITGSVFLTGSLNVDGEFTIKDAATTVLAFTASQALQASQSFDTTRYGGILARDFGANVPTLYVSATDGDDANDGRTIQFPLKTVKRAAQLATPGFDGRYGLPSGSKFSGYVIRVQAGTYIEENPVILPKNASIWGSGLRITKINAKNPDQDLFYVNSGCYIAEVTMGGLRLWPDQINPQRGFAVAFQPGAFITTSPYIQNCSQISNQENSFTELYEDIPPGGGGLYVNGDVINPDSPLASMVLDAYTQISPNGVGCLVNGRGFIQLVSFFTNFAYYAIRVNNGGHATLNNSNISFGLYGMYASGSRQIDAISGGNEDAKRRVRASYSVIVDVLNKGLEEGLPTVTTLNTAEGIKVTPVTQSYTVLDADVSEIDKVSQDFRLVSEIVKNGIDNYPALLAKSSTKGYNINNPYNILGAPQITSSISASISDLTQLSASYATVLSIFADGTGSYSFKSNTADSIKVSDIEIQVPTNNADSEIQSKVSSSFTTIINIINGGNSPTIVSNNSASLKVTNEIQYLSGIECSGSTINSVSASFSTIYNILDRGTGSSILPIPENHQTSFNVSRSGSNDAFEFEDIGNNPSLTLFRGETYKFFVSASVGKNINPFWIRTQPISGFTNNFDYNNGIINNGDDFGLITFTVPFDAPNELYYVSQNSPNMVGNFNIINNSETPFELIENTLTYPKLISTGSVASSDSDIHNAYNILINNKTFIQEETIAFISASWSEFNYNETTCKRDIGFIIDAVANDLLYDGNSESITAGLFYYLYPSDATTTQKDPTLTAIKYVSGLAQNLLKNIQFTSVFDDANLLLIKDASDSIFVNKEFFKTEVISYISSSWSEFDYNEDKCSRDVGYMVDAVATDLLYGGNERSVEAGNFYFKYPSEATTTQLTQTIDGVRFLLGSVINVITQSPTSLYTTASLSTQTAYNLLLDNKELIQNETIQFINTTYPTLEYNQISCSRDVGFIIDAVATDLLYGGIERGVKAGRFYYDVPSIATSRQKIETIAGIAYANILSEYIVQNIILETPSVIKNIESLTKVSALNNITSSISGTETQSNEIIEKFNLIQNILRNTSSLDDVEIGLNIDGNIKVTNTTQYTSSLSATNTEANYISSSISIVNTIIRNGEESIPILIKNIDGLIKVNDTTQITSSISASAIDISGVVSGYGLIRDIVYNGTTFIADALVSNYSEEYGFHNETPNVYNISSLTQTLGNVSGSNTSSIESQTNHVTSSYNTIINIVSGGLDELPIVVKNTNDFIKVTNTSLFTSIESGSLSDINKLNSLYDIVLNIVESGSSAIPTLYPNSTSSIKVTDTPQIFSSSYGERIHGKIVSSSFGLVANILENGSGSIVLRTGSLVANTNPKVINAYTVLVNNADFIIDETIAFMSSSWSEFQYDQSLCERDLDYIISGSAFDLLYGGNSASFANGVEYLNQPSMANDTQLDQTLTAIGYASGLAEKVIQGVIYTHISASELQNTSASYTLIRNNKSFIVSESIAYLSSSWSEFEYNQISCSRDIKYIIDAVSTDLLYGGNERSIVAGDYYYKFPSEATTIQLQPTLDGIGYSNGLAVNLISGLTPQTASSERQYVYDLISDNREFIRTEGLAYVNAKYEDLIYDNDKCFRDLGYILDAVRTDVLYGGNERTAKAGEFYYLYPSKAINTQLTETLDAINYTGLVTDNVIKSNLIPIPQIIPNNELNIKVTNALQYITSSGFEGTLSELNFVSSSIGIVMDIIENGTASYSPTPYTTPSNDPNVLNAYNLLIENISFIQSESIAYVSSSWSTFIYNEASCSRDVGLIVSGAAEDLLYGVNSASIVNGKFYYEFPSEATGSQLQQTLDGIRYASGMAQKIVLNTLFVTASNETSASYELLRGNKELIANEVVSYVSSSWSSAEYSESICKRDVGFLIDAVSTDILYGGNERSVIAGRYYYDYPSQATTTQKEPTATAIEYASDLSVNIIQNNVFETASLILSEARDILRLNKSFIQNETIAYISSSWSGFEYNEASCSRDTGYIVDAVATDLLYGGNERSVEAGRYYYLFPSEATTAQLEPTIDGITYAGRLAQKVIQNVLFETASIEVSASVDLLRKNRAFIQAETIEYVSSSWSQVAYNEESCSRDVGFIVDAVTTDLLYGGEERSVNAADFYYRFPSRATVAGIPSETNQLDPTLTGIRYAGEVSSKVILNNVFTAPSQSVLTARELLIGNKQMIQAETIAFLSSSWSTLEYNEISCSRDVGYIIDGVATDLLYGGNESSIQAGSFYYLIPSVAIADSYTDNGKVGQKIQTVDGINFVRGLAEKVVAKTQLIFPSVRRLEAVARLIAAKDELKRAALSYTNGAFPFLVYNEASCSRDTGLIVDALATDLKYGGNERGIAAASSYYNGQYGSAAAVVNDQRLETLETNRYLRTKAEFIAANAPKETFGSLIVATGIDYSYNGSGVTFKALPPNQGGSGVPNPDFEITELGGGRIFFTSGNQDGDFRIGTGLSINQATGTLVGRTFSKSLFSLVTPFSLALEG
jgi:hypothetical protein